jgi:hypothetical protein
LTATWILNKRGSYADHGAPESVSAGQRPARGPVQMP